MKIINYGHACFKIEGSDFNLIFDPYQKDSVPNLNLNKISANALFISHEHHDHNARELVEIINPYNVKYKIINTYHDKENGKLRGDNKITIVEVDGFKIAHFGDIGVLPSDYKDLMDIDIILVPINGYYTINALECLEIYKKTNAKILIPMHFFIKNQEIGYPDGNQIDILISNLDHVNYIENDEIEFNKNDRGVYIFKKARQ